MTTSTRANRTNTPTPLNIAEMIGRDVKVLRQYTDIRQEIKVLDPCCGSGTAVERFAQTTGHPRSTRNTGFTGHTIRTYGVERNSERAQRAAKRLNHTLNCDLFGTTIANHIFNVLFLNPPGGAQKGRTEHRFLTQCARYLAPDGLLIYIIPRERLKTSARHLAEHYGNISCRRFPIPEYRSQEQLVIMATRRDTPVPDPDQMSSLLHWASGDEPGPPELGTPLTNPVILKTQPSREILFTRRTIEPQEAIRIARTQGLWNRQDIRNRLWPNDPNEVKPLMPLRKGHLAMLIAAGFLNNMLLEQDGQRIIVKGRTSKNQVRINHQNGRNRMLEEVWQERMRINITTLDLRTGEFTELRA